MWVWHKKGPKHANAPTGAVQSPTATINPDGSVALAPGQFTVDYDAGLVFTGRAIATGEVLEIQAELIDATTILAVSAGGKTFDLNDRAIVKGQFAHRYTQGQTLAGWFQDNLTLKPNDLARRYGSWLTANQSERRLEFVSGPTTQKGVLAPPVRFFDPRLRAVTAQYFAASSYGTLQVLPNEWLNQDKAIGLNKVLDIATKPIFDVLSDWRQGLRLGGSLHRREYERQLIEGGATCQTCENEQWHRMWSAVFHRYNTSGPEYGGTPIVRIVQNGRKYEPR